MHPFFAINFTILQAHVPYTSEVCDDNYIQLVEYHDDSFSEYLLNLFCGHVRMESLFSTYRLVQITIYATEQHAEFDTFLSATYEVLLYGESYGHNPDMENTSMELPPSNVRYIKPWIYLIWYFTNTIDTELDDCVMKYFKLNIWNFECEEKKSNLHIYAGALSLYTARWASRPVMVISCAHSSTEPEIDLDVSHHVTLLLQIPISDITTNLNMTLSRHETKCNAIKSSNTFQLYTYKHSETESLVLTEFHYEDQPKSNDPLTLTYSTGYPTKSK